MSRRIFTSSLFHRHVHQPPLQSARSFWSSSNSNNVLSRTLAQWSIVRNSVYAQYPRLPLVLYGLKVGSGFLLSLHIFVTYFYSISLTEGISMTPTMAMSGERVLISKTYRNGRGIQVGDVVSFKHPLVEEMGAIKRVVGMPGDFVIRDSPHQGRAAMIQIPQGHCYVVGDNLAHSRDSRIFGPLPLALIKGKVVASILAGRFYLPYVQAMQGGLQDAQDYDSTDD